MDSRLPSYPEYKTSGVPWLGDVPAHWRLNRLKHCVTINASTLPETTPPDYFFQYLDIGSVGSGTLLRKPQLLQFEGAPSRARRIIRAGDTIVSTVRTYLKAVYFVVSLSDTHSLICSTGFAVLSPTADVHPKFVSYLAQSDSFTDRVTAESVGVVYPAIAETRLGSLQIPLPPLDEQLAIIRYLDHIDRRVRRYIRAKQRLLALLREQKQAIIHQAVTRGLDASAPLKPSGVAWLGEVPAHWEMRPLKRVSPRLAGRLIVQPYQYFVDNGVPIVFAYNIRPGKIYCEGLKHISFDADERFAYCRARAGDLLTVRVGAPGTTAVIPKQLDGCHFASTMLIRQSPAFSSYWLAYIMNSQVIQAQINLVNYGAAQQQFNIGDAANFVLPVPPLNEQTEIVHFLDLEAQNLDKAIESLEREVSLIREYRTRLIADVVTGKVDVQAVAAALPAEVGEDAENFGDDIIAETQVEDLGEVNE